jgi:hypothetical protein
MARAIEARMSCQGGLRALMAEVIFPLNNKFRKIGHLKKTLL